MPSRTLSPRISTTVMTMSLLMTIDSFFFLDSTSIGVYLSVRKPELVFATNPLLHSFGDESTRLREGDRRTIFCALYPHATNFRGEMPKERASRTVPGTTIKTLSSFPTVKAGKLRRQGAFCLSARIFPVF